MSDLKTTLLKKTFLIRLRQAAVMMIVLVAGVLLAEPSANAMHEDPDVEHGATIVGGCMDDRFPGELGCTANDVRVSGVADVGTSVVVGEKIECLPDSGPDGKVDQCDITFAPVCDVGADNADEDCSSGPGICKKNGDPAPELCGDKCAFAGDFTSFAATFIVELSAQARYDIGLYFGIDGDPNGDGALTGSLFSDDEPPENISCSISTLPEDGTFTRPDGTSGSFVDLDTNCKGGACPQREDLCGDINSANNPIYYDLASTDNFITAKCIGNENNELLLPSCTSWRQSGANEVCLAPDYAFPGSPSKCNCDPTFSVPIDVPAAELVVTKDADPTWILEPDAEVRFDITVENTGIDPTNSVTLNSLVDDIYGDITKDQDTDPMNTLIRETTCSVPQTINPGTTITCSFWALVSGNASMDPPSVTDIVTAAGRDAAGNDVVGSDDATVDIRDVPPAASLTKTATEVVASFTVVVTNESTAEDLFLDALVDDKFCDITTQHLAGVPTEDCGEVVSTDCTTGGSIAIGGTYTCSFDATINLKDLDANGDHKNTVTGTVSDDEGNSEVTPTDNATATVSF